jgi:MtrB/PioB family decaheme-associated outer membrane protein
MENRSLTLSLAVASVLLSAGLPARAQEAPDPAAWTCSKCPFEKGYTSAAQLGAGYVDDSSARFGDYTGLDEEGAVVVASAEGRAAFESGYRLDYALNDLGLDSRSIGLAGGKQGSYEFDAFYDRVPHRLSDTGETIYSGIGSADLSLPAGWTRAGTTAGMAALGSSLRSVEVGFDRDRYGLGGRFFLGNNWSFGLDYRRDERSGTRPKYGSFGSVSAEFLRPIDDATDRLDATLRYEGSRWFAQVGYFGSLYDTKAAQVTFDNPFTSFVAGGDAGQMALEPDNAYSEIAVSLGWFGLPWNTAVTAAAAIGQGSQDANFTGYTINPTLAVDGLPFSDLDGDVSVTRVNLTISSRPVDRLRLRGAVAYDERDNDSRQAAFTSIVHTDLFPVGEDRINAIYGYERTRLTGSADFDVYDDLTIGVGGEFRTTDRTGTNREASSEDLTDGFGRAQFRPSGYLGFVVKGGIQERDPDRYDVAVATANGQNPLMRKYDMAYRYRSYGEFLANVAVGSLPLALGASAFYGDDSYLQSDVGLVSGLDRRYGVDLSWTVSEKISAYASLSREKIDSKVKNSSVFGAPDWRGDMQDDYETYGAGARWQVNEKLGLNLDYTFAQGNTHTAIVGAAAGSFPTVKSDLSSFKADVQYGISERMDLVVTWWYETFDSQDWAYASQPNAMPTVLGLGVDPYNYDVNYFTASVRYRFGGSAEGKAAE